jgi:type VI secretion system FHA domain protein
MRLFLKVVSEQAATLGYRQSHVFDRNGGTLGRSKSCDWVLPDETTTLSAKHALVRFNGRGFLIEDTSTNGVYLNSVDAPLGRGNAAILSDGDILYLGHFVVEVAVDTRSVDLAPEPWASPAQPVQGHDSPLAVPPAPSYAAPPPPAPQSGPLDALARLSEARPVVAPLSSPARPAVQPAALQTGIPAANAPAWAPPPPPQTAPASPILPPTASLFGLPDPVRVPPRTPNAGAALPGSPASPPAAPAAAGIPDDFFDTLVVPPAAGARGPTQLPPPQPMPPPPHGPAGPPVIPLDFDFANPGGAPPAPAAAVPVPPPVPMAAAHPPAPVPAAPAAVAPAPVAPAPVAPVPVAPAPVDRQRPPLSADLAADLVALRLPGREAPAPVADPMELLRQRAARRALTPERRPPDALTGLEGGAAPPPEGPPMPVPMAAPPVAAVRPVQVAAAPPMPLPAAVRGAPPETADPFAPVWSAFGLDPASLAPEEKARLADEFARALASLAEGLVVTLGGRRMVKDTFRMDQTQLRAQGNNPFKFASSGTAALRHFVGKDRAGFLSLAKAIDEGFADIRSHELAAMMAAQTMIGTLLDDLSPRRIEEATPAQGLLSRKPDKARLWETFTDMHAQRAQSVAGTTQTMFGAAFAQAYQHQVALKQESKP